MDYILFNSDGSLNKKQLKEYIQQGSSLVNQFFISYPGAESTDIAQAVFLLPNDLTSNTEVGTWAANFEYKKDTRADGWIFTLTEDQTRYHGLLIVTIRVIRDGTVLVNYPFALVINQTGARPDIPTGVTIDELDSYLMLLQSVIKSNGVVRIDGDSKETIVRDFYNEHGPGQYIVEIDELYYLLNIKSYDPEYYYFYFSLLCLSDFIVYDGMYVADEGVTFFEITEEVPPIKALKVRNVQSTTTIGTLAANQDPNPIFRIGNGNDVYIGSFFRSGDAGRCEIECLNDSKRWANNSVARTTTLADFMVDDNRDDYATLSGANFTGAVKALTLEQTNSNLELTPSSMSVSSNLSSFTKYERFVRVQQINAELHIIINVALVNETPSSITITAGDQIYGHVLIPSELASKIYDESGKNFTESAVSGKDKVAVCPIFINDGNTNTNAYMKIWHNATNDMYFSITALANLTVSAGNQAYWSGRIQLSLL